MPRSPCNPCCAVDELDQSTLVTKLLELQEFQIKNEKWTRWIDNLACLCIDTGSENLLQLSNRASWSSGRGGYIAVSYSSKITPGLESDVKGNYRITGPPGHRRRRSRVRDEVLKRVIQYACHRRIYQFWIDKECLPTRCNEERQAALNSMDLVYRECTYAVGLLAVTLETQDEIDKLRALLAGRWIVEQRGGRYPKLRYPAAGEISLAVMKILRRLFADRWWTRAWIYQEEYLSATRMRLLIRYKRGLVAGHEFGTIPGEIYINASRFRQQATLFLLAFKKQTRSRSRSVKCVRMLKGFGKYNVQYHFQPDAYRRAMSLRIFADIQRRGLEKTFDYIPIVANSCSYAIRFDSKIMSHKRNSIGLCLLAMYLFNGEILRDPRKIKKLPTEMDLCNYLLHISFNKFDPPVKEKHLAYLKECRFNQVSLSRLGISTKGFLWKVRSTFSLDIKPRPDRWSTKRDCSRGLKTSERDYLHHLAIKLSSGNSLTALLRQAIHKYLANDEIITERSPAQEHMDLMAVTVVEAIRICKPLYIASMQGSTNACGIFVGIQDPRLAVFTSWHDGNNRYGHSHVSIAVRVDETATPPLLETIQWVNGLVFLKHERQSSVTFRWPQAWT